MQRILLILSMFIAGCSYFSPDYQKPQLDLPTTWNTSTTNTESAIESLPYLAWWKKFNDPILNRYIESGLENNYNIQSAKTNLERAQAQMMMIKLGYLPFLNLFGGYINGSTQNSLTPIGNLGAINNTGAFFAILPTYTLNLFTNYTLQKQAGYNIEAAENAILRVRLAVIGQVTAAYFANLAQEQLLEQFTKLNSDAKHMVTISQAMNKRGLSNQLLTDELQNKQKLIEGQLAIIRSNLTATQNALHYLLNQYPGKINDTGKFKSINPNQVIPGNLPVAVIASRPDIMEAEAALKAANEGISVASSALLPSMNLNYFYAQGSGSQSLNSNSGSVNNSNTQNYYAAYANWTISPSVFGAIDINRADFKAALANYKYVVNTALHEVDNALATNNGYQQKTASDESAYQNLEHSVKINQAMYNRGLINYSIVLNNIIEQDIMDINMTQNKLQQLISLVTVYQSLGGGYNYESAPLTNTK